MTKPIYLVHPAARLLPLVSLLLLFLTKSPVLRGQTSTSAPEVSRVLGAQLGLLGIYGYAELPLKPSVVGRVDVGFDAEISGGSGRRTIYTLIPLLSAGPRWYYNLSKRVEKGKRTADNAANFLELPVAYRPGWFALSSQEGVRSIPQISLIPTWGVRRQLGSHLNFEVGVGAGYVFQWDKYGYRYSEWIARIPLRIGF